MSSTPPSQGITVENSTSKRSNYPGAEHFAKPRENYDKFVRPWRLLNAASFKYKIGAITESDLARVFEHSYQMMTDIETAADRKADKEISDVLSSTINSSGKGLSPPKPGRKDSQQA
jgi:hypothetical protein